MVELVMVAFMVLVPVTVMVVAANVLVLPPAAMMTPVPELMLMPAGRLGEAEMDHVRVPMLLVAEEAVATVTFVGPGYIVVFEMAVMTGVE